MNKTPGQDLGSRKFFSSCLNNWVEVNAHSDFSAMLDGRDLTKIPHFNAHQNLYQAGQNPVMQSLKKNLQCCSQTIEIDPLLSVLEIFRIALCFFIDAALRPCPDHLCTLH